MAGEENENVMAAGDTELLSHRAEVFRSKLISDFHLLEAINEQGSRTEAPRYYSSDFAGILL